MLVVLILFLTGLVSMFSVFYRSRDLSRVVSLVGIVIATISIVGHWQFVMKFPTFFVWTPLATIITLLALICAFFILLHLRFDNRTNHNGGLFALMLFSLCGAVLLFGMSSLVTLFLGIEILSIPLYVLAAGNKDSRPSLEAGLKYFILGSFSSAMLLFGIALVYGCTGDFYFETIMQRQQQAGILPGFGQVGILLILVSMFFKLALVPFHFWSPDVYEGSPTMVTAYMSIIVKMAGTLAMYYLLNGFFALQANIWINYTIMIISLSLIVSSILGMVQNHPKRLLAYSSISHAAFLMLGIMIALLFQSPTAMTFYLIAYGFASLIVFVVINNLSQQTDIHFDTLNGLAKGNKLAGAAMAVALLSMAGIPSTGGFIAKWNILKGAFDLGPNHIIFGLAILSSAIGIVYYLRMINRIYFYPINPSIQVINNWSTRFTLAICIAVIIALGLLPSDILFYVKKLL